MNFLLVPSGSSSCFEAAKNPCWEPEAPVLVSGPMIPRCSISLRCWLPFRCLQRPVPACIHISPRDQENSLYRNTGTFAETDEPAPKKHPPKHSNSLQRPAPACIHISPRDQENSLYRNTGTFAETDEPAPKKHPPKHSNILAQHPSTCRSTPRFF